MEKPSYYAIIPANVRYNKSICPHAKLLYGEITALCNKNGKCWASNRYFSELYNVSTTSISKWFRELKECGYVKIDLIYKEGTKEILHRYVTLITYPIEEKLHTPIEEKFKDNNTVINNTGEYTSTIVEVIASNNNNTIKEKKKIFEKKDVRKVKDSKFGDGELHFACQEFYKLDPGKYPKEFYESFLDYWTSPIQKGAKRGMELWRDEKTFGLGGRLATSFRLTWSRKQDYQSQKETKDEKYRKELADGLDAIFARKRA